MSYSATRIQNVDASTYRVVDGVATLNLEASEFKYPNYAPTWDLKKKYEPYEEFEHDEPGFRADPNFKNLFPKGVAEYTQDLTPKFGTEVKGVQLSSLSDAAKDDLALFIAQRGVAVFRDQDLKDLPISEALKYSSYFGRNHIHPTSGAPAGHPEIHLVHRAKDDRVYDEYFANHTTSVAWHSDVSYERQPPGTTFLAILESPPVGGDTVFTDTEAAYDRLSPEFQKRLRGLTAVHSGYEQAEHSRSRGGPVRREPVKNVHPVVRTHPVTKKRSLYVNTQFTRNIVGFKQEESDALLRFLYDHIAKSADIQARAKWAEGTVVVWDNRRAVHSALLDWDSGERRHAFRLTPQAEIPFEDEEK